MLTILAVPKAFRGHIATIQRNAIHSWLALSPRPQVILFADEQGTAEVAHELGAQYVAAAKRNEHGTPLLSGVIEEGKRLAVHNTMCYINGDIILTSEFGRAIQAVSQRLDRYLAISKRVNLDISEPMVFDGEWESRLAEDVEKRGILASETFIDIFVFPKKCYERVPAFAIGRPWFDHWFIKFAIEAKMPVVELTPTAPLIHQNHDYAHVNGGMEAIWRSAETENNLKLYGKIMHDYTLDDATHQLRSGEIVQRERLKKGLAIRESLWELLVVKTYPWRKRLGLRRATSEPAGKR